VDFDRRVRLEFRGAQLSSDGSLLVMRELDDALGLSDLASAALCDSRLGENTVHRLGRSARRAEKPANGLRQGTVAILSGCEVSRRRAQHTHRPKNA